MGICFSKKTSSSPPPPPSSAVVAAASPTPPLPLPPPNPNPKSDSTKLSLPTTAPTAPEETVKKEIFIIKQRKSHERRPEDRPHFPIAKPAVAVAVAPPQSPSPPSFIEGSIGKATPVRTSSCTKEEVDAILIQCGRLSRSSSGTGKASEGESGGGRKYSGSKRSFDFDQDNKTSGLVEDEGHCSRTTHRRTLSREKDEEGKRSGSRHRSSSASREEERKRIAQNGGSTSRRLSRSPGRRSETTPSSSSAGGVADKSKGPGKMVSVPASTTGAIKRVSVKRSTASPRSQSPANARENAHQQHPPSLSRNSSRKAEHSPYRRNPLGEIDDNCLKNEPIPPKQDHQTNKKPIGSNKVQSSKEIDEATAAKKPFQFQSHSQSQKADERSSNVITDKSLGKNKKNLNEQEEQHYEGNESRRIEINTQPPQTITRSRSSRRSRDLDFLNNASNPNDEDTLVNVPTSYASLLLEDIQNFHQKNPTNSTFTLPPCVTKACSILDAVADLNSSNTSHVSNTITSEDGNGHSTNNKSKASSGKKDSEVVNSSKDPFVETEVFVYDDIMEPSIHKYITVRRGKTEGGGDMEQQESSGSNSVVGQQWFSSSSWEPNSADSTDHWTSSSNTGDEVVVDKEEPSHQHKRKVYSEGARKLRSSGNCSTQLNSVTMSGKKRELDQLPQGGKLGAPPVAAAASM